MNCVGPEEVELCGKHGKDVSDLRDFVSRQGAVAFVANGSILPRISGDNDLPARTSNQLLDGNGQENGMAESKETNRGHVVAFKSPEAFEGNIPASSNWSVFDRYVDSKRGYHYFRGGDFKVKPLC